MLLIIAIDSTSINKAFNSTKWNLMGVIQLMTAEIHQKHWRGGCSKRDGEKNKAMVFENRNNNTWR